MKRVEVEHWAITLADRVKAREPLEDSRVELKAEWPEAVDAARRIAGHANAAHGDPILWIIGLDEKRAVVGATANDLATWYPGVQAEFDGLAPAMEDFVVPYEGKTLVAMLFDTSGAPFAVRNPVFGKPGGGSVSREVPWREGTSVRSATRTDLVRLLVPLQRLPDVEVLEAVISQSIEENRSVFHLEGSLYFIPHGEGTIVIPSHRVSGGLQPDPPGEIVPFDFLELNAPEISRDNPEGTSKTVRSTYRELMIHGPGEVEVRARARADRRIDEQIESIDLRIDCQPAFTDRVLAIRHVVPKDPPEAVSSSRFFFQTESLRR